MATARLTASQKQELVKRFQGGEATQALAEAFGCSPTTVTRLVRTEMGADAYAALREERQKRSGRENQLPLAIAGVPPSTPAPEASAAETQQTADPSEEEGEVLGAEEGRVRVLAIDDADDFGEDDDEEDVADDSQEMGDFHPVAVLPITVNDQQETRPAPWSPEQLPACAYLLVEKTVELQARPLGEMPELGRLPREELERQALVLFTNPRQAKRQCGRNQRVIKVPDPSLLGRTAPYLLAQGISRVVIEGALYALPERQ